MKSYSDNNVGFTTTKQLFCAENTLAALLDHNCEAALIDTSDDLIAVI